MAAAPEIRSLGLQTDIDALHDASEVLDLGECIAVRSPSMPTYHWGNFLLYRDAPEAGDLERWTARFAAAFADLPDVRHRTFTWDDPSGTAGAIEQFEQAGYEVERLVVLSTEAPVEPPRFDPDLDVRAVTGDADWRAVLECNVACRDEEHAEVGYRRFLEDRQVHFRHLVDLGMARWLAAWVDGQVVGNLGIVVRDGRCRYQAVETHPDFRRRGACSTLVHRAARAAIDDFGARRLVMVADELYHAARIYESCGFRPSERYVGVRWFERTG